ncbi:MAG TPA: hypothetical protein VF453_06665 [Burkholderiaceae bacterium]
MIRSLRVLPSLALAVVMSVASTAFDGLARVVAAARDAFAFAVSVVRSAFRVEPAAGGRVDMRSSAALTAASAFVKRMVKRDAPRIEARWSMCPSI